MKVERLIRHLQSVGGDAFRAAGEMVGNELPRNRLNVLREARSALAQLFNGREPETISPYYRGYVDALRDVMASYELVIADEQDLPPDDIVALIQWRDDRTDRHGEDLIDAMVAWFTRPELGTIDRVPPEHAVALRKFQAVDYNTQVRTLRKVLDVPVVEPKHGWGD